MLRPGTQMLSAAARPAAARALLRSAECMNRTQPNSLPSVLPTPSW
jgi:hypothetical protein